MLHSMIGQGWYKEDRGHKTKCWIWKGKPKDTGYGQQRVGPKMMNAHKFVYEHYKGPVPKDKQLDHQCNVRICVNPGHLKIVTQAQNLRRGEHVKLTGNQVKEIRSLYSTYTQGEIAEMFDVHPAHISRIVNNHIWN